MKYQVVNYKTGTVLLDFVSDLDFAITFLRSLAIFPYFDGLDHYSYILVSEGNV